MNTYENATTLRDPLRSIGLLWLGNPKVTGSWLGSTRLGEMINVLASCAKPRVAAGSLGKNEETAMENGWKWTMDLIGGDWNHGILWLSHINWECHHPNWRTHIFQRGRLNHQPDLVRWFTYCNWWFSISSSLRLRIIILSRIAKKFSVAKWW